MNPMANEQEYQQKIMVYDAGVRYKSRWIHALPGTWYIIHDYDMGVEEPMFVWVIHHTKVNESDGKITTIYDVDVSYKSPQQ